MSDKNEKTVEIYVRMAEEDSKNFDSVDSESDLIFLDTFLSQLELGASVADLGCGIGFLADYFVKKVRPQCAASP